MFDALVCDATLEDVVRCRRAVDACEADFLAVLAAYDRSGRYRVDGYANAACALAAGANMDRGTAHRHVDTARKLQRLERLRRAMADGEVSGQHASVIARACTPARADAIAELEDQLVEIAKRVPPRGLREVVERVTDALDGDGGASNDQKRSQRRRLHLSSSLDGMVHIDGFGDAVSGEAVFTAITAEMERDLQAHDPRTTEQRRWDALTNICRRALDHGELGSERRALPHVSYVIDADQHPLLDPDARSHAEFTGRASQATIDLILCDCSISRVITRGRSQILDVGRATRTISAAQWRALVVRDRHCQGRGCTRPPGMCQGHHIVPWPAGGPTDLANLKLLCWHCHRAEHNRSARSP